LIRIERCTAIHTPIERCFDLSRSIDLHMASTDGTGEKAVAGVVSGLIGPDQTVTWRGRHFGFPVTHMSRITGYSSPTYFQDSMVRGLFRRFCHDHYFEQHEGHILMKDVMEFEAPFGFLGKVTEQVLLLRHMSDLLDRRNRCIKKTAESDLWKHYL